MSTSRRTINIARQDEKQSLFRRSDTQTGSAAGSRTIDGRARGSETLIACDLTVICLDTDHCLAREQS